MPDLAPAPPSDTDSALLPRRIAIVGSGAVGCYYGGRLAEHGREVHFLMRSDYETVKAQGLRITSPKGNVHLQDVLCARTPEEIGPCDLVIIAMKSTANTTLETLLPPLLHRGTLLLTLQNGLGNEEFLAERFGAPRVLGGLCHVCINRTAPGVIEHLAQGLIAMGEYSGPALPRTRALAADFQQCSIQCTVEESLKTARWRKLVWNIPFNGLSIAGGHAGRGLDTAQILSDEALTQRVRGLMHEVIGAARKLGCEIPSTLADDMIHATKSMGGYRTSSLIDYEAHREVELDAIWGEPLRRARSAGAEVGLMECLYQDLKTALGR